MNTQSFPLPATKTFRRTAEEISRNKVTSSKFTSSEESWRVYLKGSEQKGAVVNMAGGYDLEHKAKGRVINVESYVNGTNDLTVEPIAD